MTALAPTLQLFFTERLARQLQASPQTVTSYRNTFRLLLRFIQERTGKAPSRLDWDDLSAGMISAFLDHLETGRGNSARSRNARLAALRSLFRYAALRHPEHAQLIQQVLAIPQKRFDRAPVSFLTLAETSALLAAPDPGRWEGRRDRALLTLAAQTGLRLSELTGLTCSDIQLAATAHVRCTGKGRKQRCVPLTPATAAGSSSFSSAIRRATSRSNIATTKCPLPMHGTRHVSSFAAFGQLSKVPAAGVHLPPLPLMKRKYFHGHPGSDTALRSSSSLCAVSANVEFAARTLPACHAPSVLSSRKSTI